MDSKRWKRIDSLLHAALELPPAAHDAFLRQECLGDDGLEREIRSLIAYDQEAGSFLDHPIAEGGPGLPDRSTVTNLASQTVSHYQILEMLGAGGMGVVYKAFDTKLNRLVALKFLPPHLRHDPELKRRLSEEARAASTLDHPNIVVIHDIDETSGGDLFIAMAFHEGETLRERIEREKPNGLPAPEALQIARQVAEGLGKAHGRGILHRDIKPGNVIVAKDGVTRIIDFGLAKSSDARTTVEGSTKGTPMYMSPEQASGKSLDCRTDLWSLGAVLFEMLTGRPPFTAEGNLAMLRAIVNDAPPKLRELRPDAPAAVELIVARALEKDVARRYRSAGEMASDLRAALEGSQPGLIRRRGFSAKALVPAAAAALALAGGGYFYAHRTPKLTDKDTVILGEFKNNTRDAAFDETLRQGLASELQESPFLRLIADDKIQQTLKLMNQPADAPLTPDVARAVCERTGSAAVLDGSIGVLGSQYVLTLRARNCRTGDELAREQAPAARKEDVLSVLGQVGSRLRARMGESLATVREHNTPLAEATTSSLEALKAYSTGLKVWSSSGPGAALPFFREAIDIDPQFAVAHSYMGAMYNELWEPVLATQSIQKAYELRNRAGARERFQIAMNYDLLVTGDLEKVQDTCQVWTRTYPRDGIPQGMLSWTDQQLGKYEQSVETARKAVDLDPDFPPGYNNLAWSYVQLGHLPEAEDTLRRAFDRKLDFPEFAIVRFYIAFLKGDRMGMEREAAQGQGKQAVEDWIAYEQATVLAWSGHLREARRKSQEAMDMAHGPALRERAASYKAGLAVREAFFMKTQEARQDAAGALEISTGRDVKFGAALALALIGDRAQSQALAKQLEKLADDTWVQSIYLPTLRALWEVAGGDASGAIAELRRSAPYELGVAGSGSGFYGVLSPVYVRGLAYLKAGRAVEAAGQFQKVIDRPGIVFTDPVGILARIGLAKAHRMSGDTVKAKAAYNDFLTLWKDADQDIPILTAVKAEYARMP